MPGAFGTCKAMFFVKLKELSPHVRFTVDTPLQFSVKNDRVEIFLQNRLLKRHLQCAAEQIPLDEYFTFLFRASIFMNKWLLQLTQL